MQHFWDKNFDKVLLASLFVFVYASWLAYGIPEVRDIARDLVIAIVALASGQRRAQNEIQTDQIQTGSMDGSTVTAQSVDLKGE